ncbi:MAG: S-layer homology domain-containing protein [Clostridia bacterium]|nr:S-layer homology domain-containing protein [Clostridia bacterium]
MKMKFLTGLIVALLSVCLLSGTALARTDIYTKYEDDGSVTVHIKSDGKAAEYATVVTFPGTTIKDITETTPWKVLPIQAENGGSVVVTTENIGIPDVNGVFSVYVGGGELKENAVTHFAAGADSAVVTTALDALNKASNGNAVVSVIANENYNHVVWCIDANRMQDKDIKNAFAGLKREIYDKGYANSNDVEECFRKACALSDFAQASKGELKELVTWYKDEMLLDLNETAGLGHILDGKESIEEAFYNLKSDMDSNPITTIAELKTVLRRSEALGMLNDAERSELPDIWNTYGIALGLKDANGSYVNPNFTSVNAYELAKFVVRNDNKADFRSLQEVKTTFDEAINTLMTPNKPNNVPNNGGGGGSRGLGREPGAIVGDTNLVSSTLDPGTAAGTKTEAVSEFFTDLPISHWACRQIEYAAKKGIISGDGDGTCRPDDGVTRAEFIQMIVNSFDLERPATGSPKIDFLEHNDTKGAPEGKTFTDVAKDDWYFTAVDWGSRAGVINGYEDGRFGVSESITRQDAAVILARVKEACSIVINKKVSAVEFTDVSDIAQYAVDAVKELQQYNVINGYEDGTFQPTGNITRAEAVKLIYTMLRLSDSL